MADDDRASKIEHENKMIRRLRFLVDLTFATIAQDNDMTLDQGWEHVLALKGAAVGGRIGAVGPYRKARRLDGSRASLVRRSDRRARCHHERRRRLHLARL